MITTTTIQPTANTDLQAFINGYIECALWSSAEEGEDWSKGLSPESHEMLASFARVFYQTHYSLLSRAIEATGNDWAQAGHDLWLNHSGHGAGFWDGDWDEPCNSAVWHFPDYGKALDSAARRVKPLDLCLGDDGLIHGSGWKHEVAA